MHRAKSKLGRRVLVIAPCVPPQRIAEGDHAFLTCKRLAAKGLQVTLLTVKAPGIPEVEDFEILPVLKAWSWRGLPGLVRTIRKTDPDSVLIFFLGFLYDYKMMVTFLPQYLALFSRRTTLNVLFTDLGSAGGLGPLLQGVARRVGKYRYGTLLTGSHKIFYLSEGHRQKIVGLAPAAGERLVAIPTPPLITFSSLPHHEARSQGRRRLGIGDETLFTYFGRIYPGKGLETLFDAFARLVHGGTEAKLLILGGFLPTDAWSSGGASYEDQLKNHLKKNGIADRVIWSGEYRLEEDLASLYLSASDIAVLPFDGGAALSNSSLAAVASHELPIVSTAVGEPEAPLRQGQNGLYCPPKDPEALAAGMHEVMSDPVLRNQLRAGARSLYRERFSWEMADDVLMEAVAPKEESPELLAPEETPLGAASQSVRAP